MSSSLLALFSLLSLISRTKGDVLHNSYEISIPRFRFERWNDLSFQDLARQVAYNESLWETLRMNSIEKLAFVDLASKEYLEGEWAVAVTSDQPNSVLADMGFTEDVWDCWINHYGGYEWSDLVTYEISSFYEALGWTEDAWNSDNESDYPESDSKGWSELSAIEQKAAANLCHIEQTWNVEPFATGWLDTSEYLASIEPWLTTEPVAGPLPCPDAPSGGCSVCGEGKCVGDVDAIFTFPGQPTVTCALLQEAGYTGAIPADQCPFLSVIPQLGVCDCATSIPGAPTLVPTSMPTHTFMPTQSIQYNSDEISLPRFRFQRWMEDIEIQDLALELAYDTFSWETLYQNGIEEISFGDLASKKYIKKKWKDQVKSEEPNKVLASMGFIEDVWDCWINHYGGYEWSDLKTYKIAPFYEALGWTEDAWNSYNETDYPESNSKGWGGLTPDEQRAATDLCYLEQTWNEEPFSSGWLNQSDYLASVEPWILSGSSKSKEKTPLSLLNKIIIISVAVLVAWIMVVVGLSMACRRSRLRRRQALKRDTVPVIKGDTVIVKQLAFREDEVETSDPAFKRDTVQVKHLDFREDEVEVSYTEKEDQEYCKGETLSEYSVHA